MPPKHKRSATATQRPPPKRTRASTQESLPNPGQTRQSTRTCQSQSEAPPAASSPSNANSVPTTSSSSSSTQSTGEFSPQEVLCQLSNVLLQLTNTMQANALLPRNTDSTPVTPIANNSTQEADDSNDALSEASIEQQQTDPPANVPLSTSSTMTLPATTSTNVGHVSQMGTRFDVSLPPVPPRVKEKIISGEFVDFATLLPSTMFSGSIGADTSKPLTVQLTPMGNDLSVRSQPPAKKITSFTSWMEAWNIYLAILIDHSPVRAPQLMAYQGIITSASTQYPLAAWLNYDIQFRTLAASDPSLRWDTRHTDLWLQCVIAASTSAICWPCSHCGETDHYPQNCPFRSQAIPAPTNGQRPTTTSTSNDGQQPISGGLPNFRLSTCHAYNRSTCCR